MACHTTRLELQSMIYEVWPQFLVTALLLRREEEEGFVKIYKCMFLNIKCAPKINKKVEFPGNRALIAYKQRSGYEVDFRVKKIFSKTSITKYI